MHRKLVHVLALFTLTLAAPNLLAVDTYKVDPVHSGAAFKIRHLVTNVTGRFTDFDGTIQLDREDLTRSSVAFTIKAASIDTDNEKRDTHLRSADFFDTEKYPEITFKSTKILKTGNDTYSATGNFTLHGVTKEISVPVQVLGFTSHPRMGDRAGFSTNLKLNRKDYGINWNSPLDAGSFVLGEEVEVSIDIEAAKPKDEPPKEGAKAPAKKEKG